MWHGGALLNAFNASLEASEHVLLQRPPVGPPPRHLLYISCDHHRTSQDDWAWEVHFSVQFRVRLASVKGLGY